MSKSVKEILYTIFITTMIMLFLYGVWLLSAPPALAKDGPGQQVCNFFEAYGVNEDTVMGIGLGLMDRGYSPDAAADLVKGSVLIYCPWLFDDLGHAAQVWQDSQAPVSLR